MKGMAVSDSSPVVSSRSVRTILSAYTTRLPCSPLRTQAFNSSACLKVIQIGAAMPFSIASAHSIKTLMPLYGTPLKRSGRVIRPAACSTFHGLN